MNRASHYKNVSVRMGAHSAAAGAVAAAAAATTTTHTHIAHALSHDARSVLHFTSTFFEDTLPAVLWFGLIVTCFVLFGWLAYFLVRSLLRSLHVAINWVNLVAQIIFLLVVVSGITMAAAAIGISLIGYALSFGLIGLGFANGFGTIISDGAAGVRIQTDKRMQPGNMLLLGFHTPDSVDLVARAVVRAHTLPKDAIATPQVALDANVLAGVQVAGGIIREANLGHVILSPLIPSSASMTSANDALPPLDIEYVIPNHVLGEQHYTLVSLQEWWQDKSSGGGGQRRHLLAAWMTGAMREGEKKKDKNIDDEGDDDDEEQQRSVARKATPAAAATEMRQRRPSGKQKRSKSRENMTNVNGEGEEAARKASTIVDEEKGRVEPSPLTTTTTATALTSPSRASAFSSFASDESLRFYLNQSIANK